MKLDSFLIVSIFIAILWTYVKTVSIRKALARRAEKDYTATEILNDGAESSVNPQIQKYKETLKPKLKIRKVMNKRDGKVFNKSEYNKEYYQKNKKRILENKRNYQKRNKQKANEIQRNYYKRNRSERIQYQKSYNQKNKETVLKKQKMYDQNNKEKRNEYKRKHRQEKKRQSDNNEGTSFVNPQTGDFGNKGKLPIVCEESFEEGNLFNQGEEEQNQIEVEEPNKILEDNTNHIDLDKKIHSFDLNEKPEDEELEKY